MRISKQQKPPNFGPVGSAGDSGADPEKRASELGEPDGMSFYFPDPEARVDPFPPLKPGTRVLLIGSAADPDSPFARIFAQGVVSHNNELGDPVVDLDEEWPARRASVWRRICESLGLHR